MQSAIFRSGNISSEYLKEVYSTLLARERTRSASRWASREANHPPAQGRKRDSWRRILGVGSNTGSDKAFVSFYSVQEACTEVNEQRNRYGDIEPYDRNRVLVGVENQEQQSGRYLNASWVREIEGKAWWVAAQAPLFDTTHAFLSLFTSLQPPALRLRTIIQLTPTTENGIRKADQYIPSSTTSSPLHFYPEPERSDLPAIEVTLKSEESITEAGCTISTVELKLLPSPTSPASECFEIKHINYVGWPDHSVPSDPGQLVHLARKVSEVNTAASPSAVPPPILCHCSAGVGRTGTFIALSSLLRSHGFLPTLPSSYIFPLEKLYPASQQSPLGPLPSPGIGDDPVAREVDGLREQRTTMVQRGEQLAIIYQILVNIMAER
ncbi:hypothetical protein FRB99_006965 [Tulasnella sp. 403]|nr:hypothetical protein FRB99_006965 [Tulasnella sp. 403]